MTNIIGKSVILCTLFFGVHASATILVGQIEVHENHVNSVAAAISSASESSTIDRVRGQATLFEQGTQVKQKTCVEDRLSNLQVICLAIATENSPSVCEYCNDESPATGITWARGYSVFLGLETLVDEDDTTYGRDCDWWEEQEGN